MNQEQEGLNKMGITQQFVNMLGANDEETEIIIDKMSTKTAKELLKVLMKGIKKYKNKEGVEDDYK